MHENSSIAPVMPAFAEAMPVQIPDAPLTLRVDGPVAWVAFNRPHRANALDFECWQLLRKLMQWVDQHDPVRAVVLHGEGRHFCAGLDLALLDEMRARTAHACEARSRERLRREILDIQDTVTAIERCRKPVIAAVHGACVGGGVDIISACDLRLCSDEAWFSVMEIDVALVADVGTLQRLPRLVGEGMAREMALTGRRVGAAEARELRLVSRVLPDPPALRQAAAELAAQLSAKSPLAMRGTKDMMLYSRDHSVADALERVAIWNAAMLFSRDLDEVASARREARTPLFDD